MESVRFDSPNNLEVHKKKQANIYDSFTTAIKKYKLFLIPSYKKEQKTDTYKHSLEESVFFRISQTQMQP